MTDNTDIPRDDQMPDDMIMIYADGGLTPDQREVVRNALLRDPELMRRYESFVFTRGMIARPFDAVLSAPIPEKLLRTLGASARTRSEPGAGESMLGRLVAVFRVPAFSMAVAIPSLLVAAAAGWMVHYATPVPPEAGGFAASAAVQQALESTPRGATAAVVDGVALRPTYTFATTQGAWCREFELAYGSTLQSTGIACRKSDGAWNIIAQTDPGAPSAAPAPGKFAPAGASEDPLADLRTKIKSGDVLDRREELALIERHWRPGK